MLKWLWFVIDSMLQAARYGVLHDLGALSKRWRLRQQGCAEKARIKPTKSG